MRSWFALGLVLSVAAQAAAQEKIAVTVNGQAIHEQVIERGLKKIPPAQQAEARARIVDHLIDNLLIDQYLGQVKVEVSAAEVDARLQEMRAEAKKANQDFDKTLASLNVSEAELRQQTQAEMRWEKFSTSQATDKVLKDIFERNPEMFDGSMVKARHILITPASAATPEQDAAKARLASLSQLMQGEIEKEAPKLPPTSDPAGRDQARAALVDRVFADCATKESACPSKGVGGDVGWFPRVGPMVEPFAAAAFALKPFQISEPVQTQFGWHLLLVTDRRPGKPASFDEVKEIVKDVYCDRLREYLVSQLRPRAQIQMAK